MELASSSPHVQSDDGDIFQALEGHLADGEEVQTTASVLQRVALQYFERCDLVLTDRRLVIVKPSWPWGTRFKAGYPREACTIKKVKARVDGSTLIVIDHAGDDLCFYLPRKERDGGVVIMDALR